MTKSGNGRGLVMPVFFLLRKQVGGQDDVTLTSYAEKKERVKALG